MRPFRPRRLIVRSWLPDVVDIVGLAGAIALLRGVAQIHPPTAWIVAGLLALAAAVLLARKGNS